MTALINELAARLGDDKLVVLDDYHLIDAAPVHGSLMFLVEHAPPVCTWCWPAGPTRRCRCRAATFSGSHRHVLDYLAQEVLERQSEPVRGFLLETSVLDQLSGDLCDAVTGRADGQAIPAADLGGHRRAAARLP